MASHDDVRRICAKLPGAVEGEERFGFGVFVKGKHKGFCWTWAERVNPKKAKVINDGVLAVLVPNLTTKDLILQSDSKKFFTEPHYNGYRGWRRSSQRNSRTCSSRLGGARRRRS